MNNTADYFSLLIHANLECQRFVFITREGAQEAVGGYSARRFRFVLLHCVDGRFWGLALAKRVCASPAKGGNYPMCLGNN
jgi:hypothetical protein